MNRLCALVLILLMVSHHAIAETPDVILQMENDISLGKPLVAHVIVALCDNQYQGIVPVPKAIGDGDNPRTNLYWGAGYGVKTYFERSAHWKKIPIATSENPQVLDRQLFTRTLLRNEKKVTAYVYAEAWQGKAISNAIERFLKITSGSFPQSVSTEHLSLDVGSGAHVVAYVGHNGLMDFYPPKITYNQQDNFSRSAIILACKSDDYFRGLIQSPTSLLLTTRSFMAPEAYSLEATISRWFETANIEESVIAAAKAYAKYQKISEKSARTVFKFPVK